MGPLFSRMWTGKEEKLSQVSYSIFASLFNMSKRASGGSADSKANRKCISLAEKLGVKTIWKRWEVCGYYMEQAMNIFSEVDPLTEKSIKI